jgi:hypothetical protein
MIRAFKSSPFAFICICTDSTIADFFDIDINTVPINAHYSDVYPCGCYQWCSMSLNGLRSDIVNFPS